jgi:hypothetical protein
LLLDAPGLHRAFTHEQRGEPVHERARNLALDLRRIDAVAGIGGGDEAVHLDLVAVDRDLGAGGHVAAERHGLREAAEDALRGGLAPSRLFRDRIEHGEMLGVLRHQLAPEFERIDARFLGKLIHEGFKIDGVVVDVHAAPEAWVDVRIAHGMVD